MAKWYILHVASGSENGVKKTIEDQIAKKQMSDEDQIAKKQMSDYFEEIVVPVIEVPEIKKGKKVLSEKKFMPGYILIKMIITDESWHLVKAVKKITGFLGDKTVPRSLNDSEVNIIFDQVRNETKRASESAFCDIGDKVQVIDGPFDNFSGVVESIDVEAQKLKISVSIFGKDTAIDLNFTQVKKIS